MTRSWVPVQRVEPSPALSQAVGGHPLVARLLAQRGMADPQQARALLDPALYTPASPHDLPGMAEAMALLRETISRDARVRIWGDFDADGQTATSVLYEALVAAGATVDYRLPSRDEGHGLHQRAVDEALADGIALLITCDTGIGEVDVVARGVSAGLQVIVTDHHDLPETLPPAQVVVDPKSLTMEHPLYELSGVGVAWVVAKAMLEGSLAEGLLEEMLDLVAIGLVADMARQVADVRYLTQRGLAVLRRTQRPGLRAMIRAVGIEPTHVDEDDIGYQLGPRLNAAGRLADPGLAVRLLLTRDEAEAQALAEQLEAFNSERRAHTEALRSTVEQRLLREPESLRQPALVLDGEGWELGVLGLVAGELAQRYDRPAILIAHRPGESSVASARSVEGIDIHQAIVSQRKYLLREGGHPMAAGFSLAREDVSAFRRGLLAWLAHEAPPRPAEPPLPIDAEVPWGEIDLSLARELARLAPFGAGNPRPVLRTGGGILVRMEDVSQRRETAHRRLYLDDDQARGLRFTWFNARDLPQVGERMDLAFRMDISYWRNKARLDLELLDWRPAAPMLDEADSLLVAGREILDWRNAPDGAALLAELRAQYGANLVIWAEGTPEPVLGASTRYELLGRKAAALAILSAPPDLESLRWVLSQVQPQRIVLFPPLPAHEIGPGEFVRQVAGMLRVALREREGHVDALRMAARIGARRAAVVVALRGLEAMDKIALRSKQGELCVYRPDQPPPGNEASEDENGESLRRERVVQQAREALAYLLRETRAFRQAYARQDVAGLFGAGA